MTNIIMLTPPRFLAPRAKPARLALNHIAQDGRLQSRELKSGVVKDYAAVERRGEVLPAALVVHDLDDNFWLADGYHRFAEKQESQGTEDLSVEIVDGTFDDALWLSWGANRWEPTKPTGSTEKSNAPNQLQPQIRQSKRRQDHCLISAFVLPI